MSRVYNFSAGPAVLPEEVLREAAAEMMDYQGTGMSVMEMSHRSRAFENILNEAEQDLKDLMQIPDNYKILFMQGGAHLQFAAIPMNLMKNRVADYIITGQWAKKAFKEAQIYGKANAIASSEDETFSYIPDCSDLNISPDADYVYICENNTIYGTKFHTLPNTKGKLLVSDVSSCFLSEPVDVSKFGLIYAGAQKNMAPAGLTVVIIKEELAGHELPYTPLIMNYKTMIDKDSMYNTPPCWCIYMLGLTLDWVEENGGLAGMEKLKWQRANMLYDTLDNSKLFRCHGEKGSRSGMNVTFRTGSEELDAKFVSQAAQAGFVNLKGHRKTGGMRASIYNAMPVEGVEKLCDFIKAFDKAN